MHFSVKSKFIDNEPMTTVWGRYASNDTIALKLVHSMTGEPYCSATVNIEGVENAAGFDKDTMLVIKDWSENEGIYNALVEAGVIEEAIGGINSGFVQALVCKMTDTAKEEALRATS